MAPMKTPAHGSPQLLEQGVHIHGEHHSTQDTPLPGALMKENRLNLLLSQLTQACCCSYTKMMVLTTMGGRPFDSRVENIVLYRQRSNAWLQSKKVMIGLEPALRKMFSTSIRSQEHYVVEEPILYPNCMVSLIKSRVPLN